FHLVPVTEFPQKVVTDYHGLTLAAERKSALLLDLERWTGWETTPVARKRLESTAEREPDSTPKAFPEPTPDPRSVEATNLHKKRPTMAGIDREVRKIAILG